MSQVQKLRAATCAGLAQRAFHLLASPQAAVVLLLALAAGLACGAVVEASRGAAYARWLVYESSWLCGLWFALAIHCGSDLVRRWPWRLHEAGLVIAHVGVLVLLAGGVQSRWGGWEGRIALAQHETANDVVSSGSDQLTAFWVGRPQQGSFAFTFQGGSMDWPLGRALDLGTVDGVSARLLAYHPRATATETWVADESARGGPAVQFSVSGATGDHVAKGWLVDQEFGDAVAVGPMRLQLRQAVSQRMVEDFLAPQAIDFGELGRLTMYYADVSERVAVEGNLGRRIPLGTGGPEVEIAAYLPNAVPDRLGNFTTKGEQPKNPMLELRIHVPGEDQPLRQIAFAKDPLLNLDGVYSQLCPVKFQYEHPAVQLQNAIELLQTGDGKLFGRLCLAGGRERAGQGSPRELKSGDGFDLPGQFRLQISTHLPHAKRLITYEASSASSDGKSREENQPAALVEITVGGKSEQLWLRRGDPTYGQGALEMPGGALALSLEAARVPLGFSLQLDEIRREENPSDPDHPIVSSVVRIIDAQQRLDQQRVISVNQPLTYRGLSIFQGPADTAHQANAVSFLVTEDPGRMAKYGGGIALCVGLAIMFIRRSYVLSRRARVLRTAAVAPAPAAKSDDRPLEPLRRAA